MIFQSTVLFIFGILLIAHYVRSEEVLLTPGQAYKFKMPGYPQMDDNPGNINVNFKTSPGNQIIVYCEDYRLSVPYENPCDDFRLTFSDGKNKKHFCNNQRDVFYFSSGPMLSAEMVFIRKQMVSCIVRTTEDPPNPIEKLLTPSENEVEIAGPEVYTPYFDKMWVIKSTTSAPVTLSCTVLMYEKTVCYDEFFIVNTGSESSSFCGRQEFDFTSHEDTIKVRVIYNMYGMAWFRCQAKIPPEEKKPPVDDDQQVKPVESTTNFTIRASQIHQFKSPGYDDRRPGHMIFNFHAALNSKIEVYCDDFRMIEDQNEPCKNGKVTFFDGIYLKKICTNQRDFSYISEGPSLTIEMKYEAAPLINCYARSTEEPMPIELTLDVYDGVHILSNPKEAEPFYDVLWKFHSAEGSKLSLQCYLNLPERPSCFEGRAIINTGSGDKFYCGYKQNLVSFSEERSIKLRVQLNKYGTSQFSCKVQAITGPNADQHLNLVSQEEDSSEHGVVEGTVSTSCKCGWRNQDSGRIFHGNETKVSEYPWMVGIRDHDNFQRCGGSVITSYHVLTAAHCMVDHLVRNKNEIWDTIVWMGAHNKYEDSPHGETQGINVTETFIPEEWWTFKEPYDVAVLVLQSEIRFSPYVGRICMPKIAPLIFNRQIKVTGWGRTHEGSSSAVLLETKLFVHHTSVCGYDESIFCTRSERSSMCNGDSGSPLVFLDKDTNRYTQVGIASFVKNISCIGTSGSVNVTFHFDWINDKLKRTKPGEEMCVKNM